jgi:uncharacterized protein YjiK
VRVAVSIAVLLTALGCRPGDGRHAGAERWSPEAVEAGCGWDLERYEVLRWRCSSADFAQQRAIEASGLCASDRYLYAVSEKYGTVLQIDPAREWAAVAVAIDVPSGAELEGVGWWSGTLYICDEAHATIHRVRVPDEAAIADGREAGPLPAQSLTLVGLEVYPGKNGFEGIAVAPGGERLFVLLERQGTAFSGCTSSIYTMRVEGDELVLEGEPVTVDLADCSWRLTSLEPAGADGRLLAIQSRYPGEEYRLLEIDPAARETRQLCELTGLARYLGRQGWSNNLEGLALTRDGAAMVVSDNAVTLAVGGQPPPNASAETLLLRLPAGSGETRPVAEESDPVAPGEPGS